MKHKKTFPKLLKRFSKQWQKLLEALTIVIVASIGTYLLSSTHASSPYVSTNANNGTLAGGAQTVTDPTASDGTSVRFSGTVSAGGGNCPGLANGTAAFCDTFANETPKPNSRSGDLSPVWGVSRVTQNDNPSQGLIYNWAGVDLGATSDGYTAGPTICAAITPVVPEKDVTTCDGQLVEGINDNGSAALLAMYPRQPFDFTGRTGTVVFGVSDNTQGGHGSWPSFVITDQPVPAPSIDETDGGAPAISDFARNSFGISFYGNDPAGQFGANVCTNVSAMWTTTNYVPATVHFTSDGCVQESTALGSNNQVKIEVSATSVKVYMSPAGSSDLQEVANATLTMPLTKGLVWMEQENYNGNKDGGLQQTNSLSWSNFGFDGPVEPRDLGFDVLDNTVSGASALNGINPTVNIGYHIPNNGGSLSLIVPGIAATNISSATGALLEFNYFPTSTATIAASINSNKPVTFPWPTGFDTYASETAAISVPLSDLQPGNNTVDFTTGDSGGVDIANIDLILQGAGGIVDPP
jgi:hypothetical protein